MAEARSNPRLVPLVVYDRAARGYSQPRVPMVGFVMYEIDCGVGLILRLMIDRHRHDNAVVAALFRSLGFVAWELEGIALTPGEVYLRLAEGPHA